MRNLAHVYAESLDRQREARGDYLREVDQTNPNLPHDTTAAYKELREFIGRMSQYESNPWRVQQAKAALNILYPDSTPVIPGAE